MSNDVLREDKVAASDPAKQLQRFEILRKRIYWLFMTLLGSTTLVFLFDSINYIQCKFGICNEFLNYAKDTIYLFSTEGEPYKGLDLVEALFNFILPGVAANFLAFVERYLLFSLVLLALLMLVRRVSTVLKQAESECAFQVCQRCLVPEGSLPEEAPNVDGVTRFWIAIAKVILPVGALKSVIWVKVFIFLTTASCYALFVLAQLSTQLIDMFQ